MANVAREERSEPREGGYLREVWSELRKTVWPTWPELRQMTGVVVVTVVMLGAFLGILDFGLTSLLKPLYTARQTTTATATPTPAASATPTPSASPTVTVSPSPSTSP